MSRSDAQKRADKKYSEKIYVLRVKLSLTLKDELDKYLIENNDNASNFVRKIISEKIQKEKK